MKVFVPWALTGRDAEWIDGWTIVPTVEEADIVVFTGGADISPEIYGCERHYTTWPSPRRDKLEIEIWKKIRPDQYVVGICRGAQLLCALNGGKLIQDVLGHCNGPHTIINDDGDVYTIESIHHQMMYPFDMDESHYNILFEAEYPTSIGHYEGDGIDEPPCEPEIVFFHVPGRPKCLAIQGHPEMMSKSMPIIAVLNKIIKETI